MNYWKIWIDLTWIVMIAKFWGFQMKLASQIVSFAERYAKWISTMAQNCLRISESGTVQR